MTGVEFLVAHLSEHFDLSRHDFIISEAKDVEQTRLKEAAISFYLYMSKAVRHASHDKCYEIWLERQNTNPL